MPVPARTFGHPGSATAGPVADHEFTAHENERAGTAASRLDELADLYRVDEVHVEMDRRATANGVWKGLGKARARIMNDRTDLQQNYRGVFDGRMGFGRRPAVIVVDFISAYTHPAVASRHRS